MAEGKDALDKLLSDIESGDDEFKKEPEASGGDNIAQTTDDEIAKLISNGSNSDNVSAGIHVKEDSELPELLPDTGEDFSELVAEEEAADSRSDAIQIDMERTEIPAPAVKHVNFTIKGTKGWNTKEPYSMPVDPMKLQHDYNDLNNSYYFVDQIVDTTKIYGEMKRAMLKHMSGSSINIIDGYREFIYKYISIKTKEIVDFFGYNLKSSLFIYHLGVLTLYRIIIDSFREYNIGYCMKHKSGNKVMKFTPFEFIKDIVMRWFEENINIFNISFDGISEYEDIKKTVADKYYSRIDLYNEKIDEAVKRLKLNIVSGFDRDKIFKSKWNKWFGSANIAVYNRFVDKTIFKHIQ